MTPKAEGETAPFRGLRWMAPMIGQWTVKEA